MLALALALAESLLYLYYIFQFQNPHIGKKLYKRFVNNSGLECISGGYLKTKKKTFLRSTQFWT